MLTAVTLSDYGLLTPPKASETSIPFIAHLNIDADGWQRSDHSDSYTNEFPTPSSVPSDSDMGGDQAELGLPSVSNLSVLFCGSQKPPVSLPESDGALFARLAALKDNARPPTAPAESLDALNLRLTALKGPKAAPADLQDLQNRLETLKGHDKGLPSMSELEGRLAMLKGSSAPSEHKLASLEGNPERQLLDFDPDVELNDEQLEALANMSDPTSNPDADHDILIGSISPLAEPHKQWAQLVGCSSFGDKEASGPSSARPDLSQALDSEEELSDEQLQALACMGTSHAAAVPAWAAALGVCAEDLRHDSDSDEPGAGPPAATRRGKQTATWCKPQQPSTGRRNPQ